MFTSCGFFFEDLDRIEPRNDIAFARRAISLVWQATRRGSAERLRARSGRGRSCRTGLSGADLYRQLPPVAPELLPDGGQSPAEPAA